MHTVSLLSPMHALGNRSRYAVTAGLLAVAVGLVTLIAPPGAAAETRYVSDELFVSLREGPGNQYERIRFLQTGDRAELLAPPAEYADDEELLENWAYVRDEEGDTGWMQARYLMSEPAARDRLAEAQAALEEAEEEIAQLREGHDAEFQAMEEALEASEAEATELAEALEEAQARIEELETELDAVGEERELLETNERLQERVEVLLERSERLEEENRRLAERSQQEWFLAGAGVLLVGLILGLVAPMLRRRRNTWSGGGL